MASIVPAAYPSATSSRGSTDSRRSALEWTTKRRVPARPPRQVIDDCLVGPGEDVRTAAGGVTLNLTGAVGSQPNIDDLVGSNTFDTNLSLALTATNQINVAAGTLTILGPIGGPGGITKSGTGTLALAGSNTYQGLTLLVQGLTIAVNNTALGDITQGTIVANGATLQVQGSIHIGAESLQLTGLS